MGVRTVMAAVAVVVGMALPAAAQTYTVGVENIEYYPHYNFKDGEYTGYGRAVLDAFAKAKGYTFDYRALPVARLFANFVSGDLDLKYPDNEMWSADMKKGQTVAYSSPVVAYVDGISVLPGRVGKGVDSFKVLGMVRGFTAWEWLDRIDAGTVKVQENNSFGALIEQTLRERVDGAYGNVAVVAWRLENQLKQPGALVFDPGLPHTRSSYRLSSIKHPNVIKEFDAWVAANADTVAKLKAEYGVEKGIE